MIGRKSIATSLGSFLVLLGTSSVATSQPPAASQATGDGPRPLATKQPFFSIPFYLNPNVPPPAEVVLHVSGDQGKKWTLYQRRRPDQGRFDFQAGADGEYWFVVRTSHDTAPLGETTKPEKIVIVDRQPPELKLDASRNDLGQVRVHWSAQDPRLDATSFALEYRLSAEENWQPVSVDIPEQRSTAVTPLEGQVTWTVRQTDGPVEVRAQVADQAGNRQEWLAPVAVSVNSSPAVSSATPATRPAETALPPTTPPEQPSDWLSRDAATPSATLPSPEASSSSAAADLRWRSGGASSLPADSPSFTSVGASGPASPAVSAASTGPIPDPSSSTEGDSTRTQREVRWTKATRIELDYDVADANEGGLGRVELWMTTDEGFTWNAHGVDEDLTSPFVVDLPQDGLYGFKLLIHDKQGRSASAPSAGDEADLWIGLDRVAPQVRITEAKASTSGDTSSVQITWSAVDSNLGRSPIRILYGPSPEGPWASLVDDLPNQGHYEGPTATRLPARAYLKVEVRDEAGNLGETQTAEPLGQPGRPRGIIRGFKPLSLLPRSLWK